MSQFPKWYRRQLLEHKLKDVLTNSYADQSHVAAAKNAIELKLQQQDSQYQQQQRHLTHKYMERL